MTTRSRRRRNSLNSSAPTEKRQRINLAISILCGFIIVGLEATSLKLFAFLTDDVLTPRDFTAFPLVAVAYLTLTAAMIGVDYTETLHLARASQTFVRTTRTGLFRRILDAPARLFDRHDPGDLLTRLDSDVEIAEARSVSGLHSGATAAFQIAVFSAMLVALDPLLAVACLAFAPLGAIATRLVSRRIAAIEEEARERASALMDRAAQALDAEAEVRAYGWAPRLAAEFDADGAAAERIALRATRTRSTLEGINHLVEMAAAMCVIGIGVWQLSAGQVSLGTLLAFLGFLLELFGPLSQLSGLVATFAAARVSSERLDEVAEASTNAHPRAASSVARQGDSATAFTLDARAASDDGHGHAAAKRRFTTPTPILRLDDVSFTHPGRTTPALDRTTLHVPTRGMTAITGPSGAGKSTILRLAIGDLSASAGSVDLAGRSVEGMTPEEIRALVTFVPQHPTLFTESIAANVRRAAPSCSDTELTAALDDAGVSEFANRLPQGVHTPVGAGGRTLSGGERHRIAVARALLRDTPLLVLDEPTTGLDVVSAQHLATALVRVAQERAVLVVTHDEGLVAAADTCLTLAGPRFDGYFTRMPDDAALASLQSEQFVATLSI